MKAISPSFYVAGLLVLLSSGAWAAPRLERAYFQAIGGRLLSEAFTQAGQRGQETFACAQSSTLDEKALQLANQAIKVLGKAHMQQAYLLQGRAHCLRGEAEQAVAAYRQYTSARPKNPLGQLELGFAYERLLNQDMALECWVRANITAEEFWMKGNEASAAGRYR